MERSSRVRRSWNYITASKKRKVIATLAALSLMAAPALAFSLLQPGATGSATATLGTGPSGGTPLTLVPHFSNGLAPGASEPVTVDITNPNSSQAEINLASLT